ncbi:LuxR C-terminal-related transcriptional regulator [Streptomyces collinus]|uniref:LuxR C-terminal-related transcriptional regulator n=1 Tax=Streptomyces collinus TaxID=42684 RepID=UPI0036E3C768
MIEPSPTPDRQERAELRMVDHPKLIGRNKEITAARTSLSKKSGSDGILLVGHAGSGKTRLGEEIITSVSSQFQLSVRVRVRPEDSRARLVINDNEFRVIDLASGELQRLIRARLEGSSFILWVDDAHLLSAKAIYSICDAVRAGNGRLILGQTLEASSPSVIMHISKDAQIRRIDVAPLSPAYSRQLAGSFLRTHLSQETATWVAQLSQGNPTLIRELISAAIESDSLICREGAWQLLSAAPVMHYIRAKLEAYIPELSKSSREILEIISLAAPARLSFLEALAPPHILLNLEDRKLIHITNESEAGTAVVQLPSPLISLVLRENVEVMRRRLYLDRWVEVSGRSNLSDSERYQLIEWRMSAGLAVTEADLLAAGRYALNGDNILQAMAMTSQAWKMYPSAQTAELHALTLLALGELSTLHCFLRAATIDQGIDSESLTFAEVRALILEEKYTEAQCKVSRLSSGKASFSMAMMAYFQGMFREGLSLSYQALRECGPSERGEIVSFLMAALCHAGKPQEALEVHEEYQKTRVDDWSLHRDSLGELYAAALHDVGRLQEAELHLSREYNKAVGRYSVRLDAQRGIALAFNLHEQGQPRRALEYLSLTPSYRVGWRQWENRARVFRSLALATLGEQDDDDLTEIPWSHSGIYWAIARAWKDHTEGGPLTYEELKEAIDRVATEGGYADVAIAVHELARLGHIERTERYLKVPVHGPFLNARLNYVAALAYRDTKQLGCVAREFSSVGANLYAAEAYSELARLYRSSGSERAAAAATKSAYSLLEKCDPVCTPPLQFLSQAVSLSVRERAIASFAARGLSDKEIAERLTLSPRTVSNTLYRVYKKLGAQNRKDLRRKLQP